MYTCPQHCSFYRCIICLHAFFVKKEKELIMCCYFLEVKCFLKIFDACSPP